MMLFCSQIQTKRIKPPKGFRPAQNPQHVRAVTQPQFANTNGGQKGSRKRGLLYESQVVERLEARLPSGWVGVAGPWFLYVDKFARERYAQPDWLGFCFERGLICIVEVKLTRSPKAWWQLNKLYRPLVERLFPEWELSMVEVASKPKHFPLPEPVNLVRSLKDAPIGQTSFMVLPYER